MKTFFRSLDMTFSMFSAIPMPQVEWTPESRRYILCCLPLVGLVIGLALWLWNYLSVLLGLGRLLFAAGVTLLPIFISGGIHMDGWCDTVDALSSHAEPEKKRAILKDTHTGAFAVIYTGVWLLAYFALAAELSPGRETAWALALLHILSRCLGAFAGTVYAGSTNTGLLAGFRDAAAKRSAAVLAVTAILAIAGLVVLLPLPGAAMAVCGLVLLLWLRPMSKKQFGGMSGDLAGFLITLSELVMLAAWIFCGKVVAGL